MSTYGQWCLKLSIKMTLRWIHLRADELVLVLNLLTTTCKRGDSCSVTTTLYFATRAQNEHSHALYTWVSTIMMNRSLTFTLLCSFAHQPWLGIYSITGLWWKGQFKFWMYKKADHATSILKHKQTLPQRFVAVWFSITRVYNVRTRIYTKAVLVMKWK